MDKLFKMLARGETPDFAQMMEALNSISDIDWQVIEDSQLSIRDVAAQSRVCKYPQNQPGQFCDVCD